MKIKTSELTDADLDWAVAKCNGKTLHYFIDDGFKKDPWLVVNGEVDLPLHAYTPSTDWAQGGPIVEREKIEWQWLPSSHKAHRYGARKPSLGGLYRTFCMDGPTILVAAMRCYVASKLGDEVEIPEELTESKS